MLWCKSYNFCLLTDAGFRCRKQSYKNKCSVTYTHLDWLLGLHARNVAVKWFVLYFVFGKFATQTEYRLGYWFYSISLGQWFPKCGARPIGGAQEVCREKKIERNLHFAIFSKLYLSYIYHPVLITNFITLRIFFN
jgi:hypothetical protein